MSKQSAQRRRAEFRNRTGRDTVLPVRPIILPPLTLDPDDDARIVEPRLCVLSLVRIIYKKRQPSYLLVQPEGRLTPGFCIGEAGDLSEASARFQVSLQSSFEQLFVVGHDPQTDHYAEAATYRVLRHLPVGHLDKDESNFGTLRAHVFALDIVLPARARREIFQPQVQKIDFDELRRRIAAREILDFHARCFSERFQPQLEAGELED